MTCPACGAQNPPEKRFCGDCGSALASNCTACGAPNPPGKRFCGDCGASLGSSAAAVGAGGSALGEPSAERRLVSVLFADLVGFTPYAEGRDSEEVREILGRYFDLAREVVGRYGGVIEKFIGDAVMAVWGSPVAHEDDAERAVRAALELVDAVPVLGHGIEARAGVLTGEAAVTLGAVNQGMVAGDIVNTASRLQSAASPGTVLVGETTRRAAGRAIAFEQVGDQTLKGKASPVAAWRALRVIAERGGRNRSEGLEAPFTGRAEELRLLKDLFHATSREARLRLVSVTGPAGIGKSRLAWEFLKYIDGLVEDVWWHDGRCPAFGGGLTFWALGEMVRSRCGLTEADDAATTRAKVKSALERHVPDADERTWIESALLVLLGVGDRSGPGIATDELFAAWRTFFGRLAASGPVVLVFEDLHFADSGLLDFIDSLLEWSRGVPIYVVTLARPELLEARPAWGAGKRAFNSLELEPLPDGAMRELLRGLVPGLPDEAVTQIVARADGIPLYAVETVRMLLADGRLVERDGVYVPEGDLTSVAVPESLTALIGARLDRLDPEDRTLVQDAAVLGRSFTLLALAALSGRDAATLEPRLRALVRREILTLAADPRSPERGSYAFVQALIREVAYNTLARRDRKARHLAAARFFESLGSDELAGALAGHYLAAYRDAAEGDEATALGTRARIALAAAADRAASLGAHDQAAGFLLSAAEVAGEVAGSAEQARLLLRAGAEATTAGQYDRGDEVLLRAQLLAETAGDVDGVGLAVSERASSLMDGKRVDEALALIEAASERQDQLRDETRAALLTNRTRALMRLGRLEESVVVADEALVTSEPLRLDRLTTETMISKGSALGFLGRQLEATALLAAGRQLAARRGWSELEVRATNNLAATSAGEDLDATEALATDALALAEKIGDRGMAVFMLWNFAFLGLQTLRSWDRWLARLEEGTRLDLDRRDHIPLTARRTVFLAARGRDVASETAELAGALAEFDDRDLNVALREDLSIIAFGAGDLARARALLDASHDLFPENENTVDLLARVALHQGDPARISGLLAAAASSRTRHLGYMASSIAYAEAALALAEGRLGDALPLYRRAASMLESVGNRHAVAWIGADLLTALPPDDPEVAPFLERSRELFGSVGAQGWLDRLDAMVAAAAVRTGAANASP